MGNSVHTDLSFACWSVGLVKFSSTEQLSSPGSVPLCAEGEVTSLTLHEQLWTKRRRPKHIGPPGCHCRRTEPHTTCWPHLKTDPDLRTDESKVIMCWCFYSFAFCVQKQVGTLDVLVGLSDELAKLDSFVERYATCCILYWNEHSYSKRKYSFSDYIL